MSKKVREYYERVEVCNKILYITKDILHIIRDGVRKNGIYH